MDRLVRIFLFGLCFPGLVVWHGCEEPNRKIKLKTTETSDSVAVGPGNKAVLKIKPENRRSVAVAYFENLTGDNSIDWMQRGIPEMLVTSLSQSRYLDVMALERLYSLLRKKGQEPTVDFDMDLAKAVAKENQLDYILLGRLHEKDKTLVIEVDLFDPLSAGILSTEVVLGQLENSFTMVDDLSRMVKSGLRLRNASLPETELPLAQITTSSLKAYEFFNRARWYSERLETKKAIEFFEKAVEVDSQFAMAYVDLSDEYLMVGDDLRSIEAIKKAVQYLDHATAIDREYILGAKAVHDLDFTQAKDRFKRVISADSSRTDAYVRLGTMLCDEGDFQQASKMFDKALEQNDQSILAQAMLGSCYWQTGRTVEAREHFATATKIDPNSAISRLIVAILNHISGKFHEAKKTYLEVLEKQPNNRLALLEFANFYLHVEGNEQAAQKLLEHGVKVSPNSSSILMALGDVYRGIGKYEEALELYDRVANLRPQQRLKALLRSARIHLILRHQNRAQKLIEEVLKNSPDPASTHIQIADIYYGEELFTEAKKHIDAARNLRENSLQGNQLLARYYSLQGNYDAAVSELEKALVLEPESNNSHLMLADELCYSLDRFDEALEKYEESIRRDPDNFWTYENVHWIYSELGQHQRALESIQRLIDRLPSYEGGFLLQGKSYLCLNQPDSARRSFEKVLKLASAPTKAGVRIAGVLMKVGRTKEAVPYLQKVVEKLPGSVWPHRSLADGLKCNWQLPEAMEEYRAALAIKSDDLGSLAGLGHTLTLAGRYEEARSVYYEYARKKLSPMYRCYAEKWVGMTYAYAGQYALALKHLDKSHKLAQMEKNKKMTHDIKIIQGRLLHELGRYHDAIEIYQKALLEMPHADLVRAALGLSFMKLDDKIKVKKMIDELSLRLKNGAPKVGARYLYELKSEWFYQNGELDSAAHYADMALHVRKDRSDFYKYLLAKSLQELGEFGRTIALSDEIIKSPLNKPFMVYLRHKARLLKAQALASQGHHNEARRECEWVKLHLAAADPDLPLKKQTDAMLREPLHNTKY